MLNNAHSKVTLSLDQMAPNLLEAILLLEAELRSKIGPLFLDQLDLKLLLGRVKGVVGVVKNISDIGDDLGDSKVSSFP